MRNIVLVLTITILSLGNGWAQKKRVMNLPNYDRKKLHFGFYLGSGAMDWKATHTNSPLDGSATLVAGGKVLRADITKLEPGFSVGIVTNYRLTKDLDLRFLPGMSLSGNRTLDFYENTGIWDDEMQMLRVIASDEPIKTFNVKTTYIDLPLLIKYKSMRVNNQRPYLITGVNYRFDVSDIVEASADDQDIFPFKRAGFFVEVGVGLDSYLQYFRLSTELKVSLGLSNVVDKEYKFEEGLNPLYLNAVDKLTSNLFQLTFFFE